MNPSIIIEDHFAIVPSSSLVLEQEQQDNDKELGLLLLAAMQRKPTAQELKQFVSEGQRIPWPPVTHVRSKWTRRDVAWQIVSGMVTLGLNHPSAVRTAASLLWLSWKMRS